MIYRKRGRVSRWENGTLVRVTECGVAIEEGQFFECYPEPSDRASQLTSRPVVEVAKTIQTLVAPPLIVERLIVSDGVAEHECDGRSWVEETFRIHLSIVHGDVRVLVDLGDAAEPRRTDWPEEISRIAEAFTRLAPERPAPPRLRLAPNVTAALLPALIGLAPPNVTLWQTGGGIDGKGSLIEEMLIESSPWPNWYRPSYRVRPVRTALDVRIECDITEIDRDRPIAVALLAPVDGLVLRVLVDDGVSSWPASVRITRIDAVECERVWYPYGAGSFGAELML